MTTQNTSKFAIIFDFDGVIADSMDLINLAVQKILKTYNISFADGEYSQKHAGKIIDIAIYEELAAKNIFPTQEEKTKINQTLNSILKNGIETEVKEVAGTKNFIQNLAKNGIPMAIGSGSEKWFIQQVLQKYNLTEYFQNITSSTEKEVKNGKPAPDTFLLSAKRIGYNPLNCLVIEDGIGGMQGAKQVGMKVIALDQKNSGKDFPADILTDDLSKLRLADLQNLFNG